MNSTAAAVVPIHLRTEYLENPLGIDVRRPSFGWQLAASGRGVIQRAYQVQVAATDGASDDFGPASGLLWDSGKVLTPNTVAVRYGGPELRAQARYWWRVRVWDQRDQASPWSKAAWFEMGLPAASDWRAEWIEVPWEEDPQASKPCPYFRTAFTLDQPVAAARLYITAHGLYEAWLNGERVGDQVFTPGFTAYEQRLQYQVYDVTAQLQPGPNALGAILGDGWYRGKVYVTSSRNVYGTRLGLLALLRIETVGGAEIVVATGPGWKTVTGPIVKSDMKDGETYDARLELGEWARGGYDDSRWQRVRTAAHPKHNLVASLGVPVRRKEMFRPQILTTPNGETVLDFGQNLAGVVRMRVQGPRGATVRLRHGEALDAQGNFTQGHLFMSEPKEGQALPPFQEVQYTLKGEGLEEYEPRFTVHGFRYVLLEGYPGAPSPTDFAAVAIYSDMPPAGTFACSDPRLNQLHKNVEWSMKGNFLDIPTDCPQRERAGWTGDIQIFTPSASFLMDTRAFLRKWLEDLKLEQFPGGMVGNFVPNPMKLAKGPLATMLRRLDGSAGWGDAATFIPWELYWVYGDVHLLARQYDSMKAWVEYVRGEAARSNWAKRFDQRASDPAWRARQPYIWDRGYHWGEWLEPGDGAPEKMMKGMVERVLFGSPVVATAYYARSTQILAQTAALLGKPQDAWTYGMLADQIKAAYAAEFIGLDGRISPDRQASYVRVLAFDLAPEHLKPRIVDHLVRLVREAGNHVGTGFLSTVYLCQVLADNDRLDVAYDLLTQQTIPSWLYAVTKGATTIWETWEGIDEAGNPHASLNHYSPGAVVNFLHRVVAGIRAAAPGYRHIHIHPQPGGGLTAAGAAYESVYGTIASRWAIEGGVMQLDVTVPPNTTATVRLPGARLQDVQERGVELTASEGVVHATQVGVDVVAEVGSGEYRFVYPT